MQKQKRIDKTSAVIQGVLALLRKRVSRTQIVKLVYLADNLSYESTGETITGTQYWWRHYGPNALNDSIAIAVEELASAGEVRRVTGSYMGSYTFNYWVDDPSKAWSNACYALSEVNLQIMGDVVRKYGRYNASHLAALSKKTKPFENATQYEVLRFKQNERAKEMQQWLDSIDGLKEEVELGIADLDAGRWVWADEQ